MSVWEKPIDSGVIPDSDTHFDVIVVGGGPGGLRCCVQRIEWL